MLQNSLKHYVLILLLALPYVGRAQSKVMGLGNYIIGRATPDSLNRTTFREQESYVKGTIALTCPHIRTFVADTVVIAGTLATTVVLVFYDNVLFYISCDLSETLKAIFTAQYGTGIQQPIRNLTLCKEKSSKLLSMWGYVWPGDSIRALAIYRKGYTAECKPTDGGILTIYDQTIWVLSSECDLLYADPLLEESIKTNQKE